ncbi:sulfite exporter TauE/SafE family protein [Sporanaerobacter sp. PP17-6a]|uniref:sulfite exporter TauE/SafE family protein n=1 Tax=Sporanaerobacter sp. PP17-6a TaxID=1891289 RepID=UPI0008A0195C|nr:sulfite exporter TauE/SafE family protein [Sporanaerobacter sp. PP17-6a]SCL96928.1 Sulfite exporter TauE/SafE [Sporanaerobacter sp. PP17-6a]
MVKVILILIVIVNLSFLISFVIDLFKNKKEISKEPGNNIVLAITSFIIFLLSTFGISDFAISTVLYRKLKWVSDKKLPGTLNTQCVIPVAVMALSYISVIKVSIVTLAVCIVAQVIGAFIGPRFVVKLPERTIRIFIGIGLIIASLLILAGKFNLIPSGGTATELTGAKLIIAAILLFIYGALNNIGIGSYALTMATVYALGLNPAVSFPIMMGACTFSVPVGSMQFIRFGQYSRKITLFTSTFGIIGVLIAVYFVKSLNISMLQWLIVIVLLYSSISMLYSELKSANPDVK